MDINRLIKGLTAGFALSFVAATMPASANQLTVTGTGPGDGASDLAAEAVFCITGNTLTVLLTNTSMDETLIPADLLTGVYWNIAGDPALTPISAVLGSGSTVLFPGVTTIPGTGTDVGGGVGGEFGYRGDLSGGIFNGATYGVSSTGLGEFGSPDLFGGTNLQGPAGPDGPQYGIVSAGGIGVINNNGPLSGTTAHISNSVLFTFTFVGSIDIDDIVVTGFQYGTSQDEPFIIPPPPPPDVPEPATIGLLLMGLVGVAARRSRKTQF